MVLGLAAHDPCGQGSPDPEFANSGAAWHARHLHPNTMGPTTRVLLATAATTVVVTAASYLLPERHAATGVGLCFLVATYVLVLRRDAAFIRAHGLSLGGLLEPGAINPRQLAKDTAKALAWAVGLSAIVFPLFYLGFLYWWQPSKPFTFVPPNSYFDEILGQIVVIALPEEAFYRGYVQTSLHDAWSRDRDGRPRAVIRVLGAELGWAIPVTSLVFAAGHYLTEPHPQRLAVFFPSLLFGWLRSRTGGIGAAVALHAMANLLSAALGRGFGLYG